MSNQKGHVSPVTGPSSWDQESCGPAARDTHTPGLGQ